MGSAVDFLGSAVDFLGSAVDFLGSAVNFLGSVAADFLGSAVDFLGSLVAFLSSRFSFLSGPRDFPGSGSRPPNRGDEPVRDGELRLRETRRGASADHVQCSRPHPLDVFGEVQGLRQQGVAGHRIVGYAQLFQRQRRQQPAGVPNFQAVREKHHLYTAVARVVAVRYRVDDGFGDDLRRNFVSPGRANALRPRTYRPVDPA